MAGKKATGRLGRPVDAEKTAMIVEAARQLFFAHGVEAVTIERIAQRAGGAKTTVYSKFGAKDKVVEAVVDAIGGSVVGGMQTEINAGASPKKALTVFGTELLQGVAERRLLSAEPVIEREALRAPHLGCARHKKFPGLARAGVSQRFAVARPGSSSRRAYGHLKRLNSAGSIFGAWHVFAAGTNRQSCQT